MFRANPFQHLFSHTTPSKTMSNIQKTLIASAVIAAIGLAVYQTIRDRKPPQPVSAAEEAARHPSIPKQIRQEKDALVKVLEQTEADQIRQEKDAVVKVLEQTEADRDAAKRSARFYQELSEQLKKDSASRGYPSRRHVTATMGDLVGRIVHIQADMEARTLADPSFDLGDLPLEEQQRLMAESERMMTEANELMLADRAFREKGESPEDPVDHAAVFAFGALGLDETQFQDVYKIIQRTREEATRQNLLVDRPDKTSLPSLMALSEQAHKEMRPILNDKQAAILTALGPDFPFAWTREGGASLTQYLGTTTSGGGIPAELNLSPSESR